MKLRQPNPPYNQSEKNASFVMMSHDNTKLERKMKISDQDSDSEISSPDSKENTPRKRKTESARKSLRRLSTSLNHTGEVEPPAAIREFKLVVRGPQPQSPPKKSLKVIMKYKTAARTPSRFDSSVVETLS